MLFFGGFCLFLGERTHDFAFVSLYYRRSGEEMCTGYTMAASGQMQYDYKQTNMIQACFYFFATLLVLDCSWHFFTNNFELFPLAIICIFVCTLPNTNSG